MQRRYTALRVLAVFYKVVGAALGVLTILAVIALCATSVLGGAALSSATRQLGADAGYAGLFGGVLGGLILSVFTVLYGGGLAVTLYALGEGVYLLIALEENTRATVTLLQHQSGPPAA